MSFQSSSAHAGQSQPMPTRAGHNAAQTGQRKAGPAEASPTLSSLGLSAMDDDEVAVHVADDRAVSDDVTHPKVGQPEGRRRRGNLGEQVEGGCFSHA